MPKILLDLLPIAPAIIPLVDVVKKVSIDKFGHELDYTETIGVVVVLGVVLALSHTFYPLWPFALQVAAGGAILALDAASIVKLVYKKEVSSPEV